MSEVSSPDHGIGVGMGGSCPECHAPVDLGQQFCLECGAPIRMKPEKKRPRGPRAGAASAAMVGAGALVPPRRGFPWVAFLVVIALVGAAVAFFLVGSGSDSRATRDSAPTTATDTLPELTTAPPATTATTPTVTQPGCLDDSATAPAGEPGTTDPSAQGGVGGTGVDDGTGAFGDPAATDSTALDGTTTPTIPSLEDPTTTQTGAIPTIPAAGADASQPTVPDPGATATPPAVPGADGTTGTTGTVYVDEQGRLCPAGGSAPPPTDTATDAGSGATDPGDGTGGSGGTDNTGGTGDSLSLTWPAGTSGYTVILYSYPKASYSRADANDRAAEVQSEGISAGVLDSDQTTSIRRNYYAVFHGIYDTEQKAEAERRKLLDRYPGAFVRQVIL